MVVIRGEKTHIYKTRLYSSIRPVHSTPSLITLTQIIPDRSWGWGWWEGVCGCCTSKTDKLRHDSNRPNFGPVLVYPYNSSYKGRHGVRYTTFHLVDGGIWRFYVPSPFSDGKSYIWIGMRDTMSPYTSTLGFPRSTGTCPLDDKDSGWCMGWKKD